jgi:uncharacterized membrane protein YfcA
LNAVAGGGSFIALPALLYAGVPPVSANATTTFALWPGSVSSAVAYRREIKSLERWLAAFGGVSLAGGLIGGLLLVRTSDTSFMRLLPWLMLLAAMTFTFGGAVTARFRPAAHPTGGPNVTPWALVLQLLIAIYGGYFGGGIGIMMLATLAITGMTDIHRMNGVKSVLAVAINGIALAEFIILDAIAWQPGLVMITGGIAGGYAGAAVARRLDQQLVRGFIIGVAWIMTVYFFIR